MSRGTAHPEAGVETAHLPSEVAAPSPRQLGRVWNDVPLRNKIVLMIVLAAMGGALMGMLEVSWGHTGLVLSLGMTLLVAGLLLLGKAWIGGPFERLVEQLGEISREFSLSSIHSLPIERRDEVGQIARSIHQIALSSRREHFEARQLRRTLDHRVAEATRTATRELHRIAMRDAMTDLGNRRFLEDHLEPLVESVRQSGGDLVCVVIDLDNFKTINDTLGHAAGDQVLIFLASLIRGSIRGADYAVRLGGDEFVVLMPGCTIDRAAEFSRQLLLLFQQRMRAHEKQAKPPGLSIGLSSLKRDLAKSGKELMERADSHLYEAKRAGKNQVAGA